MYEALGKLGDKLFPNVTLVKSPEFHQDLSASLTNWFMFTTPQVVLILTLQMGGLERDDMTYPKPHTQFMPFIWRGVEGKEL